MYVYFLWLAFFSLVYFESHSFLLHCSVVWTGHSWPVFCFGHLGLVGRFWILLLPLPAALLWPFCVSECCCFPGRCGNPRLYQIMPNWVLRWPNRRIPRLAFWDLLSDTSYFHTFRFCQFSGCLVVPSYAIQPEDSWYSSVCSSVCNLSFLSGCFSGFPHRCQEMWLWCARCSSFHVSSAWAVYLRVYGFHQIWKIWGCYLFSNFCFPSSQPSPKTPDYLYVRPFEVVARYTDAPFGLRLFLCSYWIVSLVVSSHTLHSFNRFFWSI